MSARYDDTCISGASNDAQREAKLMQVPLSTIVVSFRRNSHSLLASYSAGLLRERAIVATDSQGSGNLCESMSIISCIILKMPDLCCK